MKKILLILLILGLYFLYIPNLKELPDKAHLRIVFYNLEYSTSNLEDWPSRKDQMIKRLNSYESDIISVQEADYDWILALDECLSDYSYVGVGREDGNTLGEYSAVFYNKTLLELIDSDTFWLSQTPDQPSIGWDASTYRICTWVQFKVKDSDEIFNVYNTHLDHISSKARQNGSQLILNRMIMDEPILLTGDFNFLQHSKVYNLITSSELSDSKYQTDDRVSYGTLNWFIPFNQSFMLPIDFCFVSEKIEVLTYRIDNQLGGNRKPISDHYPIIVDYKIKHTQ